MSSKSAVPQRKLSSKENNALTSPTFDDYLKLLRDSLIVEEFDEIHTFVVLGASVRCECIAGTLSDRCVAV